MSWIRPWQGWVHVLFGGDPAQDEPFFPGYSICRSYPISFRWHTHCHWIELPAIPNRDNSSWLDVLAFYDVSVLVWTLGPHPNTACRYYLATSRELQRLNAVSRSPIISWFSESLTGLSTIRAFNQQAVFTEINERRVDRNQRCYVPSTTINRWLAVRLEFIGASIIFISCLLAVGALVTSGVDAGLVGLVISYALNTTSSLVSTRVMLIR
jgi:ABC-type multidrug transport system fused ATPase/permease subunit